MDKKNINLSSQFANLTWLMHKYHQRNHYKLHGPGVLPHKGQARVIKLLKIHPKISQKDLSFLLDIRPQSLGELLSKLEKNDYILRTPSETDKRVMIIELTEKGMALPDEDETHFDFSSIFKCLNSEEQDAFSEYLERIIKTLEEEMKKEGPNSNMHKNLFDHFFSEKNLHGKNPFHCKKNRDKK